MLRGRPGSECRDRIDALTDALYGLLRAWVEPVWADLPYEIRLACRAAGVDFGPDEEGTDDG